MYKKSLQKRFLLFVFLLAQIFFSVVYALPAKFLRNFKELDKEKPGRFIGVVADYFKGTSRNGNDYIKIVVSDEVGEYPIMLMDRRARSEHGGWREVNVLSQFNEKNPDGIKKDSILIFYGSKGEDILFCHSCEVMDEKIYMKLSDLKS